MAEATTNTSPPESNWAPLATPIFRMLWVAILIANIGVWTQDMAAIWLMTSVTESLLLISLLAVASNLPFLLVSFPAGVLAETLNQKTMLFWTAVFIAATSLVMAAITLLDLFAIPPLVILAYVFAFGVGGAFFDPVWKGVVPQLVEPSQQAAAFALDGVAVNVARAIGPAVAGLMILKLGPGVAFAFNCAAFAFLACTLLRWGGSRAPGADVGTLSLSSFTTSVRTGLQFARYSAPVKRILLRSISFLFPASIMWTVTPIVVRQQMQLDALGYGTVVACAGIGAVLGITASTAIQRHFGQQILMAVAAIVFMVNLAALAYLQNFLVLCGTMILAGFGWIIVLSAIQSSIVPVTPGWVRSRVIALYSLTFFGTITIGSMTWGLLSEEFGVIAALTIAIVTLIGSSLLAYLKPLPKGEVEAPEGAMQTARDTYAPFVPELDLVVEGPVMIALDYRVPADQTQAFLEQANALADVRRKNGASEWLLSRDVEKPAIFKEQYIVSSRSEYLDQYARMSDEDAQVFLDLVALTEDQTAPSKRFFQLSSFA